MTIWFENLTNTEMYFLGKKYVFDTIKFFDTKLAVQFWFVLKAFRDLKSFKKEFLSEDRKNKVSIQ